MSQEPRLEQTLTISDESLRWNKLALALADKEREPMRARIRNMQGFSLEQISFFYGKPDFDEYFESRNLENPSEVSKALYKVGFEIFYAFRK